MIDIDAVMTRYRIATRNLDDPEAVDACMADVPLLIDALANKRVLPAGVPRPDIENLRNLYGIHSSSEALIICKLADYTLDCEAEIRRHHADYREVLEEFAQYGIRGDLNPTCVNGEPGGRPWQEYLQRLNNSVKSQAKAALN